MKIEYVKGDLLQTELDYIVHGCNAQGVMVSGVAKLIREKHPAAYREYRRVYETEGGLVLGEVIWAESNGKWIGNAITQEFYGTDRRHADYDAITRAMWEINKFCPGPVAMPKIGAGLAGGDWNVIEAIIENELKTTQAFVYVLE
jgi:O-acetyl-ADP-ribose deacetylase (regulator of RNase III)